MRSREPLDRRARAPVEDRPARGHNPSERGAGRGWASPEQPPPQTAKVYHRYDMDNDELVFWDLGEKAKLKRFM
eukprot:2251909-Pyramimonas_sp.AAC.1